VLAHDTAIKPATINPITNSRSAQTALSTFDLTGKVALITGGNCGIGLGFAEGLAEEWHPLG
jgi:hypothetical protein